MPGAVDVSEEAAPSPPAETRKRKGRGRGRKGKRRRGGELDRGSGGESGEAGEGAEEVVLENGASLMVELGGVAEGNGDGEGDLRGVDGCGVEANGHEGNSVHELDGSASTGTTEEEDRSEDSRHCVEPPSCSASVDVCGDNTVKLEPDTPSGINQEIEVENGGNVQAHGNGESKDGIETPLGARRKRKRLSTKEMITPPLRRSARRAATAVLFSSASFHVIAKDEPVEKAASEKELCSDVIMETLVFPPSSKDLELDDLPVLDVFSVYACLRSFSTLLFLSPFSLKDFVSALKCNSPNSLIDSVHYSILQALKVHLECLSEEGSELASHCLRDLNWELLDMVNWPVYLAEYLLIHHSSTSSGLKLLSGEHCEQPAATKLEILRHLCDDVIEVEAIRAELNRRMSEFEVSVDTCQNESKGKDINMNDLNSPFSTKENFEETSDGNSDECCLCKMDGSLICCDGCPAAFHTRCVGMARDLLPEGDWFCPECLVEGVDKNVNPSKPFQGAEILGIDPHGCIYFASCGYLLVSEPSDTGTSYHYYSRDDLNNVLELLKAFYTSHAAIVSSISAYWRIPAWYPGSGCHIDWERHGKYLNVAHRSASEMAEGENMTEKEQHENSSSFCDNPQRSSVTSVEPCKFEFETASTSQLSGLTRPYAFSECSAPSEQAHDCTNIPTLPSIEATYVTGSPSNGDVDLSSKCSQIKLEKQNEPHSSDHMLLTSEKTNDAAQVHLNNGGYVNCYSFGHIASSLAEELTGKSSDNITKASNMSAEDIISGQLRAIYKKSMNCYWSAIQKLPVNAQKESCGWCFVCKNPSEQECLLRIIETKVLVGPRNRLVGLHSKDNRKNHVLFVIHHLLQIEDGSHGLLSGPWQNPHHKKQWRKQVFKSADAASLKYLLLTLEYHLRRIALSAEWLKPVDSNLTVGSASYAMTSERGVSRKHARKNVSETKRVSDSGVSSLSNCSSTPTIYWWRGGKLSRLVFHWKMLPQSLASKGGRQAGCRKIPGVFYPEGSEFAKRSKHVAWRAAVEMSQNVAQLAYQVKDLDSHIRWNEIGPPLPQLVKDPRKPLKPSWKATICEKCVEGGHVSYLIDFGKRKIIPDVVTKHGVLHEESSESKKYWLDESHVPVNLLKSFEVRNVEQMLKKNGSEVASSEWNRHKMANPRRQRRLSLLLSRAEKPVQNLCGHCNKVILEREEAVNCQFCEGFIHKKHFRVPKGAIATSYRCYACKDKKFTNQSKETKILVGCKKKGSTNESEHKKPVDGLKGEKFLNGNEDKKVVDECKSKKLAIGKKDGKGRNKDAKLLSEREDKKLVDECKGKTLYNRCKGKKIVDRYQKNKSEDGFKDGKIVNEVNKKRLARLRKRKTKLGKSNILVLRKSERLAKKKQHMKKGKKRNIGHKKAKQSQKRKGKQVTSEEKKGGISWRRGQRTGICPPYWLNGLLWTRKAYDEQAVHFRETWVLLPFPNSKDSLQPICSLCHKEYDSQVIYIGCEKCGDWFHGDAFSLTLVNINNVRGFKCHRCRTQSTPVCPYLGDDVDEDNLPEENNLVVDHLDDNPELQCLVHDSQDLLHEHDCSVIDHIQILDDDQQAVPMPDSGQTVILKQSIETTAEIVPTDTDAHPLTEAEAAEHSCVKDDEVKVVEEEVHIKQMKAITELQTDGTSSYSS